MKLPFRFHTLLCFMAAVIVPALSIYFVLRWFSEQKSVSGVMAQAHEAIQQGETQNFIDLFSQAHMLAQGDQGKTNFVLLSELEMLDRAQAMPLDKAFALYRERQRLYRQIAKTAAWKAVAKMRIPKDESGDQTYRRFRGMNPIFRLLDEQRWLAECCPNLGFWKELGESIESFGQMDRRDFWLRYLRYLQRVEEARYTPFGDEVYSPGLNKTGSAAQKYFLQTPDDSDLPFIFALSRIVSEERFSSGKEGHSYLDTSTAVALEAVDQYVEQNPLVLRGRLNQAEVRMLFEVLVGRRANPSSVSLLHDLATKCSPGISNFELVRLAELLLTRLDMYSLDRNEKFQINEAIRMVTGLLSSRYPNYPAGDFFQAKWLLKQGRPELAQKHLETILGSDYKLPPNLESALAMHMLAQAAQMAIEFHIEQIFQEPDATLRRQKRKAVEAKSELWLQRFSNSPCHPWLYSAEAKLAKLRGRDWEALDLFRQSVEFLGNKEMGVHLDYLGQLADFGEVATSGRILRNLLTRKTLSEDERRDIIRLLCKTELNSGVPRARLTVEEALDAYPRDSVIRCYRALVMLEESLKNSVSPKYLQTKLKEIMVVLAPALESGDRNAKLIAARCQALFRSDSERYAPLKDHLREHPEDSKALSYLFEAIFLSADKEKIDDFLEVRIVPKASPKVRELLARAKRRGTNLYPYLDGLVRVALIREPVEQRVAIFWLLYGAGEKEEARQVLRQTVCEDPPPLSLLSARFVDAIDRHDDSAARLLLETARTKSWITEPTVSLWRAKLEITAGQLEEARKSLDKLKRKWPYSPVDSLLGETYYRQGNFPKAREHFKMALKLNPCSILALTGLAQLALDEGETLEAIARLRQVAKLHGPSRLRFQFLFAAKASENYGLKKAIQIRKVLRRVYPLNEENLLDLSFLLCLNKQWRGATACLSEVQEANPDGIAALLLCAKMGGMKDSRYAISTDCLYQALEIGRRRGASSEDVPLWLTIAELFSLVGDADAEIAALRFAMKPSSQWQPKARLLLANCLFDVGKYEEAVALYQGFWQYATLFSVRKRVCECLLRLGQVEESERRLRILAGEMPDDVEIRLLEAGNAYARGKDDEAAEICRKVLARKSDNPRAYAFLSLLSLARSGSKEDLERSKRLLLKTLRIDPENVVCRELIGRIYLENRQENQAITVLNHLAKSAPYNSDYHRWLVELLLSLGRHDLLRGEIEAIKKSFPALLDWEKLEFETLKSQRDWEAIFTLCQKKYEEDKTPENRDRWLVSLLDAGIFLRASREVEELSFAEQQEVIPLVVRARSSKEGVGEQVGLLLDAIARCRFPSQAREVLRQARLCLPPDAFADWLRVAGKVKVPEEIGSEIAGRVLLFGHPEDRIPILRKRLEGKLSPGERQETLLRLLEALNRSGQLVLADDVMKEILGSPSLSAAGLNNLAHALLSRKDRLEEAIAFSRKAISLASEDHLLRAAALATCGTAEYLAGKSGKAIVSLSGALELEESAEARYYLGLAFQKEGKLEEGRTQFTLARRLANRDEDIYLLSLLPPESQ